MSSNKSQKRKIKLSFSPVIKLKPQTDKENAFNNVSLKSDKEATLMENARRKIRKVSFIRYNF